MQKRRLWYPVLMAALLSLACGLPSVLASATPTPTTPPPTGESQGVTNPNTVEDIPPAVTVNDEGGPVHITGQVDYTNPFFTEGMGQPIVMLEDEGGFVTRDRTFIFPLASQTLGQITSDISTSPFTYSLALPEEPQGTLHDVDNNAQADAGVMVFAVAYWENIVGDPFLEQRDIGQGGWSTAYASTRVSEDYSTEGEYTGGKLLVYAPNDLQGFPSEFGPDGKLFTTDDPIVRLPAGWTMVDMDVEPFVFDRAREQQIDLIEPPGAALDDYSNLSYTDAFDAMIEKLSKEYAWTDYKHVDWSALSAQYRPMIEDAQRRNDSAAYQWALEQLFWQIPDGHVSGPFVFDEFYNAVGGSIGIVIQEADDHSVWVTYVAAGSAAEQAGIQVGAEVLDINGTPPTQAIDNATPWFGPYSTDYTRRLDQMRFATRFPVGQQVTLGYQNPGGSATTATMTTVYEVDSLLHSVGQDASPLALPVEYNQLDSGYGYVKIYSFFENKVLTVQVWEEMMKDLIAADTPGLIIDMRQNGGGWGYMADLMAAYFFDQPLDLGNSGHYNEDYGGFYFDPQTEDHFILPPDDLRYHGNVVVLVGPDCASACEFFSYDMTVNNRATIVGEAATAGLGGGVEEFNMPDDVTIRFTASRAVGPDGQIHIEGIGVQPDVRVPITEQTLFGEDDAVLQAAVDYLNNH